MASLENESSSQSQPGNLAGPERWLSVAAGLGLTLAAARRGGILRRLLLSTAGASLLSRGATGYCAMKSSLQGQTTLRNGLQEQWQRTRRTVNELGSSNALNKLSEFRTRGGLRSLGSATQSIDNMHALYSAELQELHSAEQQLRARVDEVAGLAAHSELVTRLSNYANELRARTIELEGVLAGIGAQTRSHPDQAMRALINESRKMARVSGANIRDAALVASLQRIIHYKIAGYGTIAAYAKALGRIEEAARFASFADQDKALDAELTELAKGTLNPDANRAPERGAAPEVRTH